MIEAGWTTGQRFHCRICRQSRDKWLRDGAAGRSASITCEACARTWGRQVSGLHGISCGDRAIMRRLSAYLTRIEWEVMNGARY